MKMQCIQRMVLFWTFPHALINWLEWLSKCYLIEHFEMQGVSFNGKSAFYCKAGIQDFGFIVFCDNNSPR